MTRDVAPAEAERLVAAGSVHVLDVRTPEEYRRLGHIPGAILLPVDLVVSGVATLPRDRPLLVHCEHGVRSVYACELLERAGFDDLVHLPGGLSAWNGPRAFDAAPIAGPSSWLLETADLLPTDRGRALDVACGRGRHALLLAAAGFAVDAVDRDEAALSSLRATADRLDLPVTTARVDLEAAPSLERDAYALVAVFHYLHRRSSPRSSRRSPPAACSCTRRSRSTRRHSGSHATPRTCWSTESSPAWSRRSRSSASATACTRAGTWPQSAARRPRERA
jgi:rhodanese-related sulfurtransferase